MADNRGNPRDGGAFPGGIVTGSGNRENSLGNSAIQARRPPTGAPTSKTDIGPRLGDGQPKRATMWPVIKMLLFEEMNRLWRRILRRPEPPSPFADYRTRREQTTEAPQAEPARKDGSSSS